MKGEWDEVTKGWRGSWRQRRGPRPLALAPGGSPPASAREPDPLPANWQLPATTEIEQLIAARIAPRAGQGLVVGVLQNEDRRVIAGGPEGAAAFTGATLFEIGSISKVFTALLLADMVNKGEVALDDPAAKYLPAGARMPARHGREITLRDLSLHISGLPRVAANMPFGDLGDPYADYTEPLMLEFLANYELTRDIGSQHEYSNFGVGLLGYLLGRAGWLRLRDPAARADHRAARHGRYRWSRSQLTSRPRFAAGLDSFLRPAKAWHLPLQEGAGGIRSTVDDMLAFAAAMLDPGSPLAPALKTALAERFDLGDPRVEQALGWQVMHPAPGRDVLLHNGGTGGYRSALAIEPASGRAAVVLTNAAAEPSATDLALHVLVGSPVAPTPPLPPAPSPPDARAEVTLPAEELDRVVGRYAFPNALQFEGRPRGRWARRTASGRDQPEVRLRAEGPLRFFLREVDVQVRFTTDADGQRRRRGIHHAWLGAHREEDRSLGRRPCPNALEQHLGDLDRVERGALAQVVADHEQREAVRDRAVLAHAADEHRVGAGRVERVGDLGHDHARRVRQQRERLRGLERALELEVERERVAGEDGHAHARARDRELGQVEDLAALVAQLELFLGVVVLAEHVVERDHVEADRHRPLARRAELDRVAVAAPAHRSPPRRRRSCSCSSSTPSMPPPETAW
jgi:CubicO group peptidase (beta-lactamase class C family)